MSMINYASREINCKLVYYGPGLGGKTTNLEHVYGKTKPDTRGKLISLATETERTLFFDFLPVDLGTIRGFKTRFHLYTVPGQVYYNASRKLILKGVDGVVFVADSQIERMEAMMHEWETNTVERDTTNILDNNLDMMGGGGSGGGGGEVLVATHDHNFDTFIDEWHYDTNGDNIADHSHPAPH